MAYSTSKNRRPYVVLFVGMLFLVGLFLVSGVSHDGQAAAFGFAGKSFNYPYPPEKITTFNPGYNSGWFYLARLNPINNVTFWLAVVRSRSNDPTDKTAHLIYGFADHRSNVSSHRVVEGTLYEAPSKEGSGTFLTFKYKNTSIEMFRVEEQPRNIWDNLLGQRRYKMKGLGLDGDYLMQEPFLYESGDGEIPMAPGLLSLYVSIAPLIQSHKTYGDIFHWVDFQKFNIGGFRPLGSAGSPPFFGRALAAGVEPNHRWGSIYLNPMGNKAGVSIVYWDIFDQSGNRQGGDYTNIDVLDQNRQQKTDKDFVIKELEYWKSPKSGKTYLKKWRLTNNKLGVDVILETSVDNQEVRLPGRASFYEGNVRAYDPATNKLIGYGMLEQTHDEAQDK